MQGSVNSGESEAKVSPRTRLIVVAHATIMRIKLVGLVVFICNMVVARGLLFAASFYLAWSLAFSALRSIPWIPLLSLYDFWKQVATPSVFGGIIIGTVFGCVAAIVYSVTGQLPASFFRLAMRVIPKINSSSRCNLEPTFQYRSDLLSTIFAGTTIGSLAPAVGMYVLRRVNDESVHIAEDLTLPLLAGMFGAICGTVFECMMVWRAEEKEKRLTVNSPTEGETSLSGLDLQEKVNRAV
jgi:hypothetical protein